MGITERHWFEDEEPELTEQQLEDIVAENQRSYEKGYADAMKNAVPLNKLCEWLAGNAWAFDCRDCEEYCEAVIGCKNEVGSSPEYWADKLTKWMEGLDATN